MYNSNIKELCIRVKVVYRRSKKKVKQVYGIVSKSRSYVEGQRRRLKRCMPCVEVKVVCRRSKKKVKKVYVIVSRSRSYVEGQRRRLKRCMSLCQGQGRMSKVKEEG